MKKSNIIIGAIVAIAVVTAFITGNKSSWSDTERAQITNCNDSIMRLWTIDNTSDSLFLRNVCAPLTLRDIQDGLYEHLKAGMLATVTDPRNEGVGIAAPQVGIGRRLIAVQRYDKTGEPFEFYVNPRLIYLSDTTQTGHEGCLSIPDMRGEVARSTSIIVEYNDETTFLPRLDTVSGFTAVIFQHEIDHLEGILYIDRAIYVINEAN